MCSRSSKSVQHDVVAARRSYLIDRGQLVRVNAPRVLVSHRGLATRCAGLAAAAMSPSAIARLNNTRAAAITCSPACRPPRPLRRSRAWPAQSRYNAWTSVDAMESSGRPAHTAAIRRQ